VFLSYGLQFLLFEDLYSEGKTSNTIPSITISSSFLSLSHCLQKIKIMLSGLSHKTSLIVIARYLFLDVMQV
jgi:hypothetical protein